MNRFLKKLEEYPLTMTVEEIKIKVREKEEQDKLDLEKQDIEVCSKYKFKYFKKKDRNIMGEEVEIYAIENITPNSYNTDMERLYQLSGIKLSFHKNGVWPHIIMSGSSENSFTKKSLEKFEEITIDQYNFYIKIM